MESRERERELRRNEVMKMEERSEVSRSGDVLVERLGGSCTDRKSVV